MCAQLGDTILVNEVVAAMQGSYARRRQPQAEKRPAALCRHLACSKQHSPDSCCICSVQRHPIEKCWHVTGLPAGKQHMADQFKLHHHQQLTGPWINQPCVQSVTLPINQMSLQFSFLTSCLFRHCLQQVDKSFQRQKEICMMSKKWTSASLPPSFVSIYLPNQMSVQFQHTMRLTPSTCRMTVLKLIFSQGSIERTLFWLMSTLERPSWYPMSLEKYMVQYWLPLIAEQL
jgi:hypothetical protein